MPTHRDLAEAARKLIDASHRRSGARENAQAARRDAEETAATPGTPEEIVDAYRVLAEEAEAEISVADERYSEARGTFLRLRGEARRTDSAR